MIKQYIVYAHYRKDVEPCEYEVEAYSDKNAKEWFNRVYPWLTVFDVKEVGKRDLFISEFGRNYL